MTISWVRRHLVPGGSAYRFSLLGIVFLSFEPIRAIG